MLSKIVPPKDGGTRLAIVFNGSPLFTGGAGSGESDIRRWILENDWLEAVVALPDNMFYNTGISTYLWFLCNRKSAERKGKVQLIDASSFFTKLRRNLGEKRCEITDEQVAEIVKLYGEFREGKHVKILPTTQLGYRRVTVERPLRLSFQVTPDRVEKLESEPGFLRIKSKNKASKASVEGIADGESTQRVILDALRQLPPEKVWKNRSKFLDELDSFLKPRVTKMPPPLRKTVLEVIGIRDDSADVCTDSDGKPEADPELRDYEIVPLREDVTTYVSREVLPFAPDAWVNESIRDPQDGGLGIVGYEIAFNRYFYNYVPPRSLAEIDNEIRQVEDEVLFELRRVRG